MYRDNKRRDKTSSWRRSLKKQARILCAAFVAVMACDSESLVRLDAGGSCYSRCEGDLAEIICIRGKEEVRLCDRSAICNSRSGRCESPTTLDGGAINTADASQRSEDAVFTDTGDVGFTDTGDNVAVDSGVNDAGTPLIALDLRFAGNGSGRVISTPAGMDCNSNCSYSYMQGTIVELRATPSMDSMFTGWSGDCGPGSAACQVTMNSHKQVVARFSRMRRLTLNMSGNQGQGTVTSSPLPGINCVGCTSTSALFDEGGSVTLSAQNTDNGITTRSATFTHWSGDCSGTAPSCTVLMDQARSVTAHFVSCPGNSYPYGVFRGSCYWHSNDAVTWTEASQRCAAWGGHLATAADVAENNFIASQFGSYFVSDAWIGGLFLNGIWQWVDGTVWGMWIKPWEPNEPAGNGVYLEMDRFGFWNDAQDHTQGFVCERSQ